MATKFARQLHRRNRCLGMEGDRGQAGVGKSRRPPVGIGDHEVRVEGDGADSLDALHHGQSDSQVGDEVVVHDIHMHGVSGADALQFGLEVDEVGGEDARVDAALRHGVAFHWSVVAFA